jgi:hypothetical protein
VAGLGNPVHIERADGLADLADQQVGGPEVAGREEAEASTLRSWLTTTGLLLYP